MKNKRALLAIVFLSGAAAVLIAATRPNNMPWQPNGLAIRPGTLGYLTSATDHDTIVAAAAVVAGTANVPSSSYISVDTGLSSVTAVMAGLIQAPSLTCGDVYCTASAGIIAIRTTKVTSSSDTTPIAATAAGTVSYFAAGL